MMHVITHRKTMLLLEFANMVGLLSSAIHVKMSKNLSINNRPVIWTLVTNKLEKTSKVAQSPIWLEKYGHRSRGIGVIDLEEYGIFQPLFRRLADNSHLVAVSGWMTRVLLMSPGLSSGVVLRH